MTKKSVDGSVTSYVYNTEDRLTQVWSGEVGSGSLTASYYYDPFGRRLWKEVSGTRTHFHYADEGLVGEYGAAGIEIKTYGYRPGSAWTTDPLFMKVGSEYYFYHNDHLGTPQKMTAVNGVVVWSAKYSFFGKANVEVEIVVNNLRFPGQYFDSESGLHYNYHRYYDPSVGRYLRTDPIGSTGGINLYPYANMNPLRLIDPYGLEETPIDLIAFRNDKRVSKDFYTYDQTYRDALIKAWNKEREFGVGYSAMGKLLQQNLGGTGLNCLNKKFGSCFAKCIKRDLLSAENILPEIEGRALKFIIKIKKIPVGPAVGIGLKATGILGTAATTLTVINCGKMCERFCTPVGCQQ